jgi:hypothetical protein
MVREFFHGVLPNWWYLKSSWVRLFCCTDNTLSKYDINRQIVCYSTIICRPISATFSIQHAQLVPLGVTWGQIKKKPGFSRCEGQNKKFVDLDCRSNFYHWLNVLCHPITNQSMLLLLLLLLLLIIIIIIITIPNSHNLHNTTTEKLHKYTDL